MANRFCRCPCAWLPHGRRLDTCGTPVTNAMLCFGWTGNIPASSGCILVCVGTLLGRIFIRSRLTSVCQTCDRVYDLIICTLLGKLAFEFFVGSLGHRAVA